MTKDIKKPWDNMAESSQRRIDSKLFNLFWMIDLQGNYGFYIQSEQKFKNTEIKVKLKEISIIKRNSHDFAELFLILQKKEEWQIFFTLCEDLISVTHKYTSERKMVKAVELRLMRWQELLKHFRSQEMSLEKQMGLFTELSCLKDIIIPKVGIQQAIISWVGPDYDKQDFIIDNAAIEVKSYHTSKNAIVHISSIYQLHSEKNFLFLISYGLTRSNNGLSIENMVQDIRELILKKEPAVMDIFNNKLMEYGYVTNINTEPLQNFIIDKQRMFIVSDHFPKIYPSDVKYQIVSVNYSIDLMKCLEYEVMNVFFLNEV